ncbi:hypothetical protein QBC44DRAFT_329358 [Cladorrhinum sp. PSN332]|nr:hypothetical protein QBC44DRAFT_329358 [Cladorrhinum sp. PSN332]
MGRDGYEYYRDPQSASIQDDGSRHRPEFHPQFAEELDNVIDSMQLHAESLSRPSPELEPEIFEAYQRGLDSSRQGNQHPENNATEPATSSDDFSSFTQPGDHYFEHAQPDHMQSYHMQSGQIQSNHTEYHHSGPSTSSHGHEYGVNQSSDIFDDGQYHGDTHMNTASAEQGQQAYDDGYWADMQLVEDIEDAKKFHQRQKAGRREKDKISKAGRRK